ncbi:MAG: DUF2897 family protein [Vibrio sp.]
MELLLNPWVIIIAVLCVIIGNIAALKYTSKIKFEQWQKKTPPSEDTTTTTSNSPPLTSENSSIKKER